MSVKAVMISTYYFLKLSLISLGIIVKAKIRHRRAKTIFMKTLIRNGIPLEAAQELSRGYPNPMNEVLSLMKVRRIDFTMRTQ